jgi:rhodanese-related sulfurtransferase
MSSAHDLLRSGRISVQGPPVMEAEDLLARHHCAKPPLILDVRSRSSYEKDPAGIPDSIRVPPDEVENWAAKQARDRAIVAYCT